MTLEHALTVCVVLQFILTTILWGRAGVHFRELRIVYRFMREIDAETYFKVAKEVEHE